MTQTHEPVNHRADGPVDAVNVPLQPRDISTSPRRMAKLRAAAKSRETSAETTSARVPQDSGSALTSVVASSGAQDLLSRWLQANGFENLETFQKLAQAADAQKLHLKSDLPVPADKIVKYSPVKNQATDTKATSSVGISDSKESRAVPVKKTKTNNSVNDSSPLSSASSIHSIEQDSVITQKISRSEVQSLGQGTAPLGRRRAAMIRQRQLVSKTAQPLTKNRAVPLILTATLVLVLVLMILLLTLWLHTRFAAPSQTKPQIEVLGAIGAQPVLSLSEPLPLAETSTEMLNLGEGRAVQADHTVALRVTVFSGFDGKLLSEVGDGSVIVGKLSPEVLGTQLYETVKNAKEGSRYILKQPVSNADSSHMEIGVIDVIPTELHGKMRDLDSSAGITVSESPDGRVIPSVISDFTGVFRADILLEGQGATVGQGQSVLVRYVEYSYSNPPAVLTDKWSEPVKLKLNETVQQGVARGIVDQRIGSRMLIQVPPDEGAGDQPTILVMEILAAWDNPVASELF